MLIMLLAASPGVGAAQQVSPQARAQQIAAVFSKHKHVVAEKRGVRREKYKDVRSEPVVKPNVSDYSGVYEVPEMQYAITIRVHGNGAIQADGHAGARTFELQNPKIDGAILTATKAYRDGAIERFEGVFLQRTERTAPTDPGTVTWGLGVVLDTSVEFGGNTYDKLFYLRRE